MVDVTSVMVAYTIGITQSSIFLGFAYGIFDAIIVVWLRKPLSRLVRRVVRSGAARISAREPRIPEVA